MIPIFMSDGASIQFLRSHCFHRFISWASSILAVSVWDGSSLEASDVAVSKVLERLTVILLSTSVRKFVIQL